MKTIMVISDTHGNRQALENLDRLFAESDFIIHLGDTSSDGMLIRHKYPQKTYLLNGNCDFTRLGEDELVLEIEGIKLFACHGDRYGVKRNLYRLYERCEELGCTLALYGHTHEAREDKIEGVTLINPGTLSRFASGSYLYLVIHDGKVVTKIVEL